jgi:tripartite-type tricarboxylate transporter receptor subunit TctC
MSSDAFDALPFTRRRAFSALAWLAFAGVARAQSGYPGKPIRMIVPLAAGSAVDVAARLLAQRMSLNMGQSIVVENIVGAAGIIGADKVAKAAPDGYTIGGFNDSLLTMVPNLNSTVPFNPITDFAHVSQVALIDFSASVATASPYKTLAELVAAAKAAPGRITYGSGGNGSPQHSSRRRRRSRSKASRASSSAPGSRSRRPRARRATSSSGCSRKW